MKDKGNRATGVLVVIGAVVFLVSVTGAGAADTTVYPFTASFRDYVRSAIDIGVNATGVHRINCLVVETENSRDYSNYSIELKRNRNNWPDTSYGLRNWVTGTRANRYWVNSSTAITDTGNFYFIIDKPNDGKLWSTSGTCVYDYPP